MESKSQIDGTAPWFPIQSCSVWKEGQRGSNIKNGQKSFIKSDEAGTSGCLTACDICGHGASSCSSSPPPGANFGAGIPAPVPPALPGLLVTGPHFFRSLLFQLRTILKILVTLSVQGKGSFPNRSAKNSTQDLEELPQATTERFCIYSLRNGNDSYWPQGAVEHLKKGTEFLLFCN